MIHVLDLMLVVNGESCEMWLEKLDESRQRKTKLRPSSFTD